MKVGEKMIKKIIDKLNIEITYYDDYDIIGYYNNTGYTVSFMYGQCLIFNNDDEFEIIKTIKFKNETELIKKLNQFFK